MRPKIFKEPKEIYDLFEEYLKHIQENPIKIVKFLGKDAEERIENHYKPPTWKGFEAFLYRKGICTNLDKYKYNYDGNYEKFANIIRVIDNIMWDTKFSGACVGQWQHNIIAKELGMAEKHINENYERPILEGGMELPPD